MAGKKIWVNLEPQVSVHKHFSCKLSLHSKYKKVSEIILDCLNERDMDFMVEKTQFGNLIKCAADYNLSSQILWFMMRRQVYVTNDDEMWFVVNDRPIRFSRMEYALITGLNCSDNFPEELLEVSDFCVEHFQDSNKVSVKEVETKLKEMKSGDELLCTERVKMASLYFVCGALWPISPIKNPQVDKTIFSLINDFDAFNKYPWGTMAFKGALWDLRCELDKKEATLSGKRENSKSSNYGSCDMVGFIYPLQILAYECVRGIGERFAKQREGDNASLPRMCQWISNKWEKKGSPRYIDILDASKSGKKIVRSFLSPTEQESLTPYIRNIVIEDSCTDSHLSHINSLLLEGNSVYCTSNTTLCESKETLQSTEEVQETKHCPKYKSKRSSKIHSAKKAAKKQSHQVEPNDVPGKASTSKVSIVDDQSNTSKQIKALQEHVDKKIEKLENMISNLDSKFESMMKVLNTSSSTKRRLNEPTTMVARSKKKKTHKYEPGTTFVTRGDRGVTHEQEMVIEPFTSPLTHHDNTIQETTFVTGDDDGVTREQEVVIEPFTFPLTHNDEPKATLVIEDVNEGMTREREMVFEPPINTTHHDEPPFNIEQRFDEQIIFYTRSKKKRTNIYEPQRTFITEGGGEEAVHASPGPEAVVTTEMSLPQDTTPTLIVDKYVRRSKKSQFCRSPYVQLPETPVLIALCYTGPYGGSFEPVQCVSIKKVLPHVTKEIDRMHDTFKKCLYGSYDKRWFRDFLSPRHWLDTSHIQESMHGLSVLQKAYPHLVKQDVAIMDAYFSQDIGFAYHNARDDFKNSKWKNLFSYVDGYCRSWRSIPWSNASSILIPLHLPIHWVALVVNVKDETMIIYDCNLGCYTDDEMNAHIQPIEYVVQHLLHYCKVKIPDIWKITRPKEFPQNETSCDCGAWTIKTLEVALSQQTPYALDDKIVNSYRKYLAISVWYGEWIL